MKYIDRKVAVEAGIIDNEKDRYGGGTWVTWDGSTVGAEVIIHESEIAAARHAVTFGAHVAYVPDGVDIINYIVNN